MPLDTTASWATPTAGWAAPTANWATPTACWANSIAGQKVAIVYQNFNKCIITKIALFLITRTYPHIHLQVRA